jgi:type I restriction enzyme S subunit
MNEALPDGLQMTELGPLPKEWRVVRLGEVVAILMGQSPPSESYNSQGIGLPFLQGKAEFGEVYPTPIQWCSQPLRISPPGAILLSVRAPVGDVNLAPFQCCIGRGLAAICANEKVDTTFLFYWLRLAKPKLEEHGTGTTFQSIHRNVLEDFPIPLPPLPEQRAIAHVLLTVQGAKEATEGLSAAYLEEPGYDA